MKKVCYVLLISFFMFSICFASSALAKEIWNANSQWAPNNYHSTALKELSDKVYEKTNGELEIIVQYSGALGYKGPELLQIVQDNLVQISTLNTPSIAGHERVFGINTLPMMGASMKEGRIFNDICRPHFDEVAEKWNQKILWIGPWPAGLWTQKPITSVEDLKGLKVRTFDKMGADIFEAAGAIPYALPWSDVYTSLATGMIDSVFTSATTGAEGKLWEVMNYFQPIILMMTTEMVTVNLDVFNNLSDDLKEFIIQTAKEMENELWDKAQDIEENNIKLIIENGVEVVPVSEEFKNELIGITEDIRQEWLKDAPERALKIYEEAKEALGM
jgi:TRAP-type C4-dicarboxylate transport system substrate-binding protein